jgi:hypothetical protein
VRNIPASVGALVSDTSKALLPVIMVDIFWPNGKVTYAERDVSDDIKGRIIEVSEIEDVKSLTSGISDSQVSMVLDDTDGAIRDLMSTNDILNAKAVVYQWFVGVPISDRVHLFTGVVQSPLSYNRGDQALNFTILSRTNDREFGFSPEEGEFSYLPPQAIGQTWPTVYGRINSIPLRQIQEAPSAILKKGFGIVNRDLWKKELELQGSLIRDTFLQQLAATYEGIRQAYLAARFDDPFDFGQFGVVDDPEQSRTHREASAAAFAQAEQYAIERANLELELINLTNEFNNQIAQENGGFASMEIVGANLKESPGVTARIGDLVFKAAVRGTAARPAETTTEPWKLVKRRIEIPRPKKKVLDTSVILREESDFVDDQKFFWFNGGSKVTFTGLAASVKYIVGLGNIQVLAVKAKYNGVYTTVPTAYYSIKVETHTNPSTGRSLQYTVLVMNDVLTELQFPEFNIKWDSNDLWADVASGSNLNVVDVLISIIQTYTDFPYDTTTFNQVRTFVDKYKVNFSIFDRKSVFTTLQEIAYQARCVIWMNDDTFYLRYLPNKPNALYTINLDQIEKNSLRLELSGSDELGTKYVATFKPSLDVDEPVKIIYRYNVSKYGVSERTVDFYIYNNIEAVKKSAEFWSIREANAWKRITFTTTIQNLRIETFDTVLIAIDSPWVTRQNVIGVVERSTYNPADGRISVTVWLPIRAGEVDEYIYAMPQNVQAIYPRLGDTQIQTGNPAQGAADKIELISRRTPSGALVGGLDGAGSNFFSAGRSVNISDSSDVATNFSFVGSTSLAQNEVSLQDVIFPPATSDASDLRTFNKLREVEIKPYQPVDVSTRSSAGIPGYIISHEGGGLYSVYAYLRGLSEGPDIVTAQQFPHNEDDIAGENTAVRIERVSGGGYLMYMPTWVNEA